jgi:hypothetical protein
VKLTRGTELTRAQRAEVLRTYVHRWTIENHTPMLERLLYGPTFRGTPVATITDTEWIDTHAFWITKAGRLAANRRYAEPAYMAEEAP